MSGPPTNIPPSALWLALSATERPSQLVDFPRYDDKGESLGKVRIRVLTQEEQMICASAAEKVAREHMKEGKKDDLGYERLFSDAVCVEVLFRACRDESDVKKPAFPSTKDIRAKLTTEECAMLFQHYLTVQLELGPIVVSMSDDELELWVTRLAEGGSAFPFDLLSSDLQKILLLYMAYQLRTSATDSASPGPLPEESSSSDETSPEPLEAPETD